MELVKQAAVEGEAFSITSAMELLSAYHSSFIPLDQLIHANRLPSPSLSPSTPSTSLSTDVALNSPFNKNVTSFTQPVSNSVQHSQTFLSSPASGQLHDLSALTRSTCVPLKNSSPSPQTLTRHTHSSTNHGILNSQHKSATQNSADTPKTLSRGLVSYPSPLLLYPSNITTVSPSATQSKPSILNSSSFSSGKSFVSDIKPTHVKSLSYSPVEGKPTYTITTTTGIILQQSISAIHTLTHTTVNDTKSAKLQDSSSHSGEIKSVSVRNSLSRSPAELQNRSISPRVTSLSSLSDLPSPAYSQQSSSPLLIQPPQIPSTSPSPLSPRSSLPLLHSFFSSLQAPFPPAISFDEPLNSPSDANFRRNELWTRSIGAFDLLRKIGASLRHYPPEKRPSLLSFYLQMMNETMDITTYKHTSNEKNSSETHFNPQEQQKSLTETTKQENALSHKPSTSYRDSPFLPLLLPIPLVDITCRQKFILSFLTADAQILKSRARVPIMLFLECAQHPTAKEINDSLSLKQELRAKLETNYRQKRKIQMKQLQLELSEEDNKQDNKSEVENNNTNCNNNNLDNDSKCNTQNSNELSKEKEDIELNESLSLSKGCDEISSSVTEHTPTQDNSNHSDISSESGNTKTQNEETHSTETNNPTDNSDNLLQNIPCKDRLAHFLSRSAPPECHLELSSTKASRIHCNSQFAPIFREWSLLSFISKEYDDIRQDQLIAQSLALVLSICTSAGVPIWLRPYSIAITGSNSGLVETIPDSFSIHALKQSIPSWNTLKDIFTGLFGRVSTQQPENIDASTEKTMNSDTPSAPLEATEKESEVKNLVQTSLEETNPVDFSSSSNSSTPSPEQNQVTPTSSAADAHTTLPDVLSSPLPSPSLSDQYFSSLASEKIPCPDFLPVYKEAIENFTKSLAGYSLFTYLFSVKDRHNCNIMLDSCGHLIHIDFGFILGNTPGRLGWETAPFNLTEEMVDVLCGFKSFYFSAFQQLLQDSFLAVRRESPLLINFLQIMATGCPSMPCFNPEENGGVDSQSIIDDFKEKFRMDLNEEQAKAFILSLIQQSYSSWTTVQYDLFQKVTNGIIP